MAADPRRSINAIERLCAGGLDERELRIRLLDTLAGLVSYGAYAFLLTDPVTCVGASPIAAVPGLPNERLPELIRAKYLTEVNRWTALTGVATLRRTVGDRLEASQVWREVQQDLGVTDVASLVLRDRHGCWGFLDLWRNGAHGFGDEEVALLDKAAPVITSGLRGALARTFTTTHPDERLGPVVLLLGEDLGVRSQTPSTDAWLRLLNPTDGALTPVPAQAYNVAAQLVAREAGVDSHEPTARVHLAAGRWVTMRAARLGPDIAVAIEDCTPADRAEVYGLAHGLTTRELEVFALLCGGADTRKVAERLVISEHTAHDHIRAVLARTGARSRQVLLSRALGSTSADAGTVR
ncbi:helix-turn-helix transcriptional regulator [Kribbella catacumbae]|uniref:helix-turn-helix transcriptional regulator n=1 Tax=Kribbella catacumbae TaxID=460086 RepID=UPI00192AE817|nr:helix-turn-helix transcriptional regulator [Kribbella catacumbae]